MIRLTDLQTAAEIDHVVWVDDIFANSADETLRVAIQAKLKVLLENGHKPLHRALAGVSIDAPDAIRNRQIETALDSMAGRLPGLWESLSRQANNCGLVADPEEDLTPAQVVGLRDALQGVTAYSYRDWTIERTHILANADDKTLFLIDREFVKEGLGEEQGDEIVAEIVAEAPNSHCIMFTHKEGPDAVDILRTEVCLRVPAIKAHQFGVMSKRGLGDGVSDVTPHFSRALRMALLCRFCYDMAQSTSSVMSMSALDATRKMASFSVETIDSAIFENSLREGASEFEVIDRILAVNQRAALQKALTENDEWFAKLQRIRAVCALESPVVRIPNNTTEPLLHEWRNAEVIDKGEYINSLHSPLRCGDIFCHLRDGCRYVLLAQPCDLVVRGMRGKDYGKRRRDEAELVLIEERETEGFRRETNFIIKGVGEGGESWLVNFRRALSVNLRILDLAVYRKDGRVSWQLGQRMPIRLLPGWQERFRLTREELGSDIDPDAIGPLCFADKNHDLCGVFENACYCFPLERTGHIRSPYAEAILASYAAFISRAALSHDFAKSLCAQQPENGND